MFVHNLHIEGLRPLLNVSLDHFGKYNIVVGGNGSGKSTLLESMYILSSGRNDLSLSMPELINDKSSYFSASCTYTSGESSWTGALAHQSSILVDRTNQKKVVVDGEKRGMYLYLVGHFKAASYNYLTVDLIHGDPDGRRRYLDTLAGGEDPSYLKALSQYRQLIVKRNAILKEGVSHTSSSVLDIFDDHLVTLSNVIFDGRKRVLNAVNTNLKMLTSGNMFPFFADVHIDYDPHYLSVESVRASRDKEIFRRHSLVGAHLDDFSIMSDDSDAKKVLSYGQCKIVALLLTFAGAFYTKESSGDYPVLLLDDLESDLDSANLTAITSLLSQFEQVFISSNSASRLKLPGVAMTINIEKENTASGVSSVLGSSLKI